MEREIFEKNFDPIRILRNLFVAILNGCETDSLEKKGKKKIRPIKYIILKISVANVNGILK